MREFKYKTADTDGMTNWRAVAVGFAVALAVETAALAATGRVTVVGGLLGSLVAGYLSGDAVPEGATHGLLSALAWGTVLLPAVVALLAVTRGPALFPLGLLSAVFETPGEVTTALVLGVTLPNAVAGGVGSALRWWSAPSSPDLIAE